MSNPDQPLTRRQLKELRRTGQLPVIAEGDAEKAQATGAAEPAQKTPDAPAEAAPAPAPQQPAEEPADGVHPLTRKQARARRASTNQIDVVPESGTGEHHHVVLPAGFEGAARDEKPAAEPETDGAAEAKAESEADSPTDAGSKAETESKTAKPLIDSWAVRALREAEQDEAGSAAKPADAQSEPVSAEAPGDAPAADSEGAPAVAEAKSGEAAAASDEQPAKAAEADDEGSRPQVGSSFGAAVFRQAEERQKAEREKAEREAAERREAKARETQGEAPAKGAEKKGAAKAEGSDTDEIAAAAYTLSQDTSGSTAGNTSSLILKDMPGAAALSAPITASGELIMTSSHSLPEGLGAHGAAKGTTDGKDVDDVLIDGELPAHSSPMPVAASRAVSTSKAPGEVIRPPAPEKNRGLMLTLGITAGVLGIALIGVVVYVFATGQLN